MTIPGKTQQEQLTSIVQSGMYSDKKRWDEAGWLEFFFTLRSFDMDDLRIKHTYYTDRFKLRS